MILVQILYMLFFVLCVLPLILVVGVMLWGGLLGLIMIMLRGEEDDN